MHARDAAPRRLAPRLGQQGSEEARLRDGSSVALDPHEPGEVTAMWPQARARSCRCALPGVRSSASASAASYRLRLSAIVRTSVTALSLRAKRSGARRGRTDGGGAIARRRRAPGHPALRHPIAEPLLEHRAGEADVAAKAQARQ